MIFQADMFEGEPDIVRWRRLASEGHSICECCGVRMKVYRRKINSGMARTLVIMHRESRRLNRKWLHHTDDLPRACRASREMDKLMHFSFVEPRLNEDIKARSRSGFWKLTESGKAFASAQTKAPSHVFIQSPGGRILGFEETQTTIYSALGKKFNYFELMAGIDI